MMNNKELKGKKIQVSIAQCNSSSLQDKNDIKKRNFNYKSSLKYKHNNYYQHYPMYYPNRLSPIYPSHQFFGMYYIPITENEYCINENSLSNHSSEVMMNTIPLIPLYQQNGEYYHSTRKK